MAPLKVLLIQPGPIRAASHLALGLGYLAAVLKPKDATTTILDVAAPHREYTNDDIISIIKKEKYDMVGITLTTFFASSTYELIRKIANLDTLIVTGGPHVTLFPQESLDYGSNISVIGEGEKTIVQIVDYMRGQIPISDILGISYKNTNHEIVNTPPQPLIENLDEIPFPDWDAFMYHDYVKNKRDVKLFGSILTSRGCPGNCSFCSKKVFGSKYRFRTAANIIEEIKNLHRKFGIQHFDFRDDAMTCNTKRVLQLCELIKNDLDFPMTWSCITRTDFINIDILKTIRNAGCLLVNYGVESANPDTLKKIKKGISIEKVENILKKTKETGIEYSVNFMWGYPWETVFDIKNSFDFMKKIGASSSSISSAGILIPFPGTEIYKTYKQQYGFSEWWLNTSAFTGQYRVLKDLPLFRIFFFNDQGMLEQNGFFNYSKDIKREIKKVVAYIGNFNLRKQPLLFYLFGLLFIKLSYITYAISYRLELPVQTIFFFFLRLKNIRKKLR